MRIRSLRLQKYGPFEDRSVDFGQELSVVHGPNEAGKSTLLNALGDFLWGYTGRNHPRAFHYAAGKMRLTGSVNLAGSDNTWTRRLKRLSDTGDAEVTPPWDPQQTGSMDEWRQGFGLDLDSLQDGGKALIAGGGDLADVVFLAETGVAIKQIREDLHGRMDKIYKDRANTRCEVRSLLKAIDELTGQIQESEASAGDVADLRASLAALREQKVGQEQFQNELNRQIKRLEELGRCFTPAADLREVEAELKGVLASGPTLDPSGAGRLGDNLEVIRTAGDLIRNLSNRLKQVETSLAELERHPAVLGRADLIKGLGHRVAAVSAARDMVRDLGKRDSLRLVVAELLRELAVEPTGQLSDEVAGLMIAVDEREQLDRVAGKLVSAQTDVEREQTALDRAEVALRNLAGSTAAESEDSSLGDARARRDESWRSIRQPWLSGELPDESVRAELADDLDTGIRVADQIAESQAEQLSDAAEARGQLRAAERDLDQKRAELAAARSRLAEVSSQWDELILERGLPKLLDPAGWSTRSKVLQRLDKAWRDLTEHIAARTAAERDLADFAAETTDLLELLDDGETDPIRGVERLGELLTRASRAEGTGSELEKQAAELREQLQQHRDDLEIADLSVSELAGRYDEPPAALLARSRKAIELTEQRQELIQQLKSAKNTGSDLNELLAELAELDEIELTARLGNVKTEVTEVAQRIGDLQSELGSLRSRLTDLESRESISRLKAERMSNGEQLRNLVDEYRLLRLQVEMLDRYFEQAAEQTRSPVLDEAGDLLSKLTLGRYVGFEIVADEDRSRIQVLRRKQTGGATDPMKLAELSEGTADQVFLALRLAGIRARQQQRRATGLPTLPAVLDDVLTAHDDQRSEAALAVLADLAADFQIILLTHHRRVLDSSVSTPGITTVELPAAGGSS